MCNFVLYIGNKKLAKRKEFEQYLSSVREEFKEVLEKCVDFYNKHRPCYALGYDTPVNYRKRFFRGELEIKNTFENRVLSEEPKYVQKRRKQAHSENVSTFLDCYNL